MGHETREHRMSETNTDGSDTFSAEERAAMKERAKELRTSARAGKGAAKAKAEADAMAQKIAEMPDADRVLAEGIHRVVAEHAPELAPKLWYGMPGWARDGRIVFFLQGAEKFNTRYATLGFNDNAALDDGVMWPTAYALIEWDADTEAAVVGLVTRAVG
jgi:uncharacterized protein YdhG (YjbR/CyaY superfamily)